MFNKSTTLDFPPELNIGGTGFLSEKSSTKLLGVIINNKLNFKDHTEYLIKRGNSKLWLLRRLRQVGIDGSTVLTYYTTEIRPILEYAAPFWTSSRGVR